jgi:hypothetical protein
VNGNNIGVVANLRTNLSIVGRYRHFYKKAEGQSVAALYDIAKEGKVDPNAWVSALLTLASQLIERKDVGSAETLVDKALEVIESNTSVPEENPSFQKAYALLGCTS